VECELERAALDIRTKREMSLNRGIPLERVPPRRERRGTNPLSFLKALS
jgi:hypothetical protein